MASQTGYEMMYIIAAAVLACTAIVYYTLHHRRMARLAAQRVSDTVTVAS